MGRARLGVIVGALVVVPLVAAACGSDAGSAGTLPPIVTTSTSTSLLVTTTSQPKYYVVKPGDTLNKIAKSFGVSSSDLMALNGITNPDHIEVGQELKIPPPKLVVDSLPATTGASTTTKKP